jgi:hypothetical protein
MECVWKFQENFLVISSILRLVNGSRWINMTDMCALYAVIVLMLWYWWGCSVLCATGYYRLQAEERGPWKLTWGASNDDVWNLKPKCHLEFIIISQCMTLCSHYLLQNFRFTDILCLCDITWGIPSLVLSVIILWPQRENRVFFKYHTFVFYLVVYKYLSNVYFGHFEPSPFYSFRIIHHVTGQKLCHPGNCKLKIGKAWTDAGRRSNVMLCGCTSWGKEG